MGSKLLTGGIKKMAEKQTAIKIQDTFLNQIRKEKIPVTIYLMNGVPMKGLVKSFDNFVVVVDGDGKQSLIYKHAISTIIPLQPVTLNQQQAVDN